MEGGKRQGKREKQELFSVPMAAWLGLAPAAVVEQTLRVLLRLPQSIPVPKMHPKAEREAGGLGPTSWCGFEDGRWVLSITEMLLEEDQLPVGFCSEKRVRQSIHMALRHSARGTAAGCVSVPPLGHP